MVVTTQYAEYWGIDVFPYNGMCIGCGELQWHGSVPPKELRTPGWEGVQRSLGYIPGPRLDFPGLPREYRALLTVSDDTTLSGDC